MIIHDLCSLNIKLFWWLHSCRMDDWNTSDYTMIQNYCIIHFWNM